MTSAPQNIPMSLYPENPQELACRAQAGSLVCFSRLVELYQGRLYNFLLRKTGSAADAEDLAQETFLRAWTNLDRYRPRWQFSTWLYTIAGRLAINHHRKSSRSKTLQKHESRIADAISPALDPTESFSRREESDQIWQTADQVLTPEQHTMLWLRYAEDLSPSEIAKIMRKTKVSVRVTLFRARERLAECLEPRQAPTDSVHPDGSSSSGFIPKSLPGGAI